MSVEIDKEEVEEKSATVVIATIEDDYYSISQFLFTTDENGKLRQLARIGPGEPEDQIIGRNLPSVDVFLPLLDIGQTYSNVERLFVDFSSYDEMHDWLKEFNRD